MGPLLIELVMLLKRVLLINVAPSHRTEITRSIFSKFNDYFAAIVFKKNLSFVIGHFEK